MLWIGRVNGENSVGQTGIEIWARKKRFVIFVVYRVNGVIRWWMNGMRIP